MFDRRNHFKIPILPSKSGLTTSVTKLSQKFRAITRPLSRKYGRSLVFVFTKNRFLKISTSPLLIIVAILSPKNARCRIKKYVLYHTCLHVVILRHVNTRKTPVLSQNHTFEDLRIVTGICLRFLKSHVNMSEQNEIRYEHFLWYDSASNQKNRDMSD